MFQLYLSILWYGKKDYNCKYSHNMIRKTANGVGVGVKYERQFKYCGLKQNKGEDLWKDY